jgi:NADH:ubiquinone oxidoreductase subunit F (NADH-binding)
LTLTDQERRRVVEVRIGTPWRDVLDPWLLRRPVLVGGFHGRWAPAGLLEKLTVSRVAMERRGLTLGAGIVFAPPGCPLDVTARIVGYLAGQTAGRCGPCLNGLPALAELVSDLADGHGDRAGVERISRLVTGRGACAHPDGTAAMVASALLALGEEVTRHALGECSWTQGP